MTDPDKQAHKRQLAAARKRRQRQKQRESGNVQLSIVLTASQASALRAITNRLEDVSDDFSQAEFLAAALVQGAKFRANAGGHLAAGDKITTKASVTVSRAAHAKISGNHADTSPPANQ